MDDESYFFRRRKPKGYPQQGSGEQARDAGMSLTLKNNPEFHYQYFHYVLAIPAGTRFLNEDIRNNWKGVWAKPQTWSAAVGSCMKYGLIEHSPLETKMKPKKSHARKTHWLIRTGKMLAQHPRTRKPPKGKKK